MIVCETDVTKCLNVILNIWNVTMRLHVAFKTLILAQKLYIKVECILGVQLDFKILFI